MGPDAGSRMVKIRFVDEFEHGLGWMVEGERMERAAHALVREGRVWLVDPVAADGVEERLRSLGEPAGVVQLLDRHARDCASLARRLGVPHHDVPSGGLPGSPFEFIRLVRLPGWREVALWWSEQAVLVFADAVGTASYFRAPGDPVGLHPLLRLLPPRPLRDIARCLAPRHVLCGHGEGLHGDGAALALREAVASARGRLPRWAAGQVTSR